MRLRRAAWQVLAVRLVAAAGGRLDLGPSPAAYWSSNPNLPGETVTVAGSFTGAESLRLCASPAAEACQTPPGVDIWSHSAKFVLPAAAPRPLWARVTPPDGGAALSLPVNAPDVWWAAGLSGGDGVPLAAPQASSGGVLRVFGRALAWGGGSCVHAQGRAASSGTTLRLTASGGGPAHALPASAATCFEASFALAGVAAGDYSAAVRTEWGDSAPWPLTISSPTPAPGSTADIAVDADHQGNVSAALLHASTLPAARVLLGPRTYQINTTLIVGSNTQLIGHGKDQTTLRFRLGQDAAAERCGASYPSIDLFVNGGDAWSDVGNINNSTLADCCVACAANARCNAYSMIMPNKICQLKACQLGSEAKCVAQNSSSSAHESAFLAPFRPLPGFQPVKPDDQFPDGTAAIYANGYGWSLRNFTLEIASAPACVQKSCGAGVHSNGGSDFVIAGLSIALNQKNATSALILNNTRRFTVVNTTMEQNSMCFWGCQPDDNPDCIASGATCGNGVPNTTNCSMHSMDSDFKDSSLLQMHAASWGHIHHNTMRWKCSAL